jgi:preprotein translocase subunit SecE
MSKDVAVKAKEAKPKAGFFKKTARFFKDLKSEFKKIVWPSKKQVINNTGVVLAFMAITAIAIWLLDYLFINVFKLMF